MKKHEAGDIFVIPMHDGRYAFCQVICALRGGSRRSFLLALWALLQIKKCRTT